MFGTQEYVTSNFFLVTEADAATDFSRDGKIDNSHIELYMTGTPKLGTVSAI